MWKKVGRGLGLKKGEALRFSFEVQVLQVDGLPPEAHGRNCRVVLNRSAKVDFTDEKEIRPTGKQGMVTRFQGKHAQIHVCRAQPSGHSSSMAVIEWVDCHNG